MTRLRADLHKDWQDNPMLHSLRAILSKTNPIKLMQLLDQTEKEGKHEALKAECERHGIPIDDVKHYWHKGKHFSIFSKNKGEPSYQEIRDELIAEMEDYAPTYPAIKRTTPTDPHCLVVDPADIHIGKIASTLESGEEYNSQIAVQRAIEGVQGLLDKAASFDIDKIIYIAGNDILHTDTPKKTTTSGTGRDVLPV